MKFHHIWGVKQKNSPYMLRIIVFCAVKIANREKETETRKGDRIDDQIVKIAMYIYDFPKHVDLSLIHI